MKKYLAYDHINGDTKFCDTIEEAEKWLLVNMDCDQDSITEEVAEGGFVIAEVILRSAYEPKVFRKDYPCLLDPSVPAHCSNCSIPEDECLGTDEWPYNPDQESAGGVVFVPPVERSVAK